VRIISLEADNFKRLRAISITPTKDVVEITGENGHGKSSTLDAIWAALGGKDAAPAKPIRTGAKDAEIRLLLGDDGVPKLKVTRRFGLKEGVPFTTNLVVESADGGRPDKQQGTLNALIGDFCFDLDAFMGLKDEEQITVLRRFVPDVDFETIKGLNKRDYDIRTEVNRKAKEARTQAEAIPLPPEGSSAPERVNVAALENKLAQAATVNADIAQRRAARENAKARIDQITNEIERLHEEQEGLEAKLAAAPPLPDPVDTDKVQADLVAGRAANAAAEAADRRFALETQAETHEAESKRLTKAMEDRDEGAAKAVQAAKMPIDGLGFGDGFVTLNGEPFRQASMAQKIRASVAIAAAMNPKLRVARVADGSLLDKKSWGLLEAFAAEHDLQIWVETVDAKGPAAIMIEDGGIVATPEKDPGDVV
jgi:DNA repair exonuclease SbcCD ATPase subunit